MLSGRRQRAATASARGRAGTPSERSPTQAAVPASTSATGLHRLTATQLRAIEIGQLSSSSFVSGWFEVGKAYVLATRSVGVPLLTKSTTVFRW
jgi:hypothetical protein